MSPDEFDIMFWTGLEVSSICGFRNIEYRRFEKVSSIVVSEESS